MGLDHAAGKGTAARMCAREGKSRCGAGCGDRPAAVATRTRAMRAMRDILGVAAVAAAVAAGVDAVR